MTAVHADSYTHTHGRMPAKSLDTLARRRTHPCDDTPVRNGTPESHNHTLAAGRQQLPACVRLQSTLRAHVNAITNLLGECVRACS